MARNGAGIYQRVTGTNAISGETISSAKYEAQMNDFAADANAPRPVGAGGTGVATMAEFRTAAGLAVGTDVQAQNDNLQSLAGLSLAANKGLYATGASTIATYDLTTLARSFLALTTAAAQRTALGLAEGALATKASQAQAVAGTNNTEYLTALLLRQSLNAVGSAPVYGCRAWVNFNGTGTVAIRASGNVSSITDNGVGDYTVNFTTPLQDVNFSVSGSAGSNELLANDSGRLFSEFGMSGRTVSSCRVCTAVVLQTVDTTVATDAQLVSVAVFR